MLLVPAGQPHTVDWLRRAGIVSLQLSERFVLETLDVPRLKLPDFLVGLRELALLAGLSRWHFLRVFAETVGTSPHDYVTQRRLDRARNLLRTTSRSIIDIAGEVGMSHSHFSRVFSRRMGVTPTEFRRNLRE